MEKFFDYFLKFREEYGTEEVWIYEGTLSHPNKIVGDAKMAVSEYKKATKAEDNQVCDLL